MEKEISADVRHDIGDAGAANNIGKDAATADGKAFACREEKIRRQVQN